MNNWLTIRTMDFIKKYQNQLLSLVLLGFFLYVFNLRNVLFWDDADWILNNSSAHAFNWSNIKFIFSHDALASIGQVSNYYRPFLFLTFQLNYLVSGASPILYHLVNNSIHIANSIFIFALLSRWLYSRRAAFLAALLFLIHPLQTEAITYVSGRGDPLSVFFMLVGMYIFLRLRDQNKTKSAYGWASLAMVLAILSRETAVLFPLYLGVAIIAFEYRNLRFGFWQRVKKTFAILLPFLGIGAVYVILRLTVLNFQNTLNFYQQQNVYSEHLSYRLFTFFHALLVYLRLTIAPLGLHMERDIAVNTSLWVGWAWLGLLLIVAGLLWLFYAYRHRLVSSNIWFFGLAVFLINLGPSSGIIPINARIYEHWLYFSLFGAFAIVGWYLDKLFAYTEKKNIDLKPTLIITLVLYCAFLSIQTIRRNILWGNTEAFYRNILSYHPDNVRVLNNLANWYSENEKVDEAALLYNKAIEVEPSQSAPYYNLGNIARDKGDLVRAEDLYKKSVEVDPAFHHGYRNLAQLYLQQNRIPEAIQALEKLQDLIPSPEVEAAIKSLRGAL